MKTLWFVFAFSLGVIGVLGALRTVELFRTGAGLRPVQLGIAVIALILAACCLRGARTA